MTEPFTWGAVGSWTALEGIKFLYGQAAEVLKAWRERRKTNGDAEAQNAELEVPILSNTVLDGTATPWVASAVIEKEIASITRILGILAPYAQDLADVDPEDGELTEQVGHLRAVLEAAYGQRFTLRGEQREPTGTRVTVHQVLGTLEGTALGVSAQLSPGADVSIHQEITEVTPGGSIIGFTGSITG